MGIHPTQQIYPVVGHKMSPYLKDICILTLEPVSVTLCEQNWLCD